MKKTFNSFLLGSAVSLFLSGFSLAADRIELTDGSVIMGKLLSAEGGKFKVETAFAGTIEIAQDKIQNFSTAEAVNVRLTAGSAVLGKVEATGRSITIAADGGTMSATRPRLRPSGARGRTVRPPGWPRKLRPRLSASGPMRPGWRSPAAMAPRIRLAAP